MGAGAAGSSCSTKAAWRCTAYASRTTSAATSTPEAARTKHVRSGPARPGPEAVRPQGPAVARAPPRRAPGRLPLRPWLPSSLARLGRQRLRAGRSTRPLSFFHSLSLPLSLSPPLSRPLGAALGQLLRGVASRAPGRPHLTGRLPLPATVNHSQPAAAGRGGAGPGCIMCGHSRNLPRVSVQTVTDVVAWSNPMVGTGVTVRSFAFIPNRPAQALWLGR